MIREIMIISMTFIGMVIGIVLLSTGLGSFMIMVSTGKLVLFSIALYASIITFGITIFFAFFYGMLAYME